MSTDSPSKAAAVWTPPRLGLLLVHSLLAQILVGVATALWVDVPKSGNAWSSSSPSWLVNLHMLIGIVVLVGSVWLILAARRERDATWTSAGISGLVGIVAGFVGGIVFLSANGDDAASFVMTLGCVVAIGAYSVALARTARS